MFSHRRCVKLEAFLQAHTIRFIYYSGIGFFVWSYFSYNIQWYRSILPSSLSSVPYIYILCFIFTQCYYYLWCGCLTLLTLYFHRDAWHVMCEWRKCTMHNITFILWLFHVCAWRWKQTWNKCTFVAMLIAHTHILVTCILEINKIRCNKIYTFNGIVSIVLCVNWWWWWDAREQEIRRYCT